MASKLYGRPFAWESRDEFDIDPESEDPEDYTSTHVVHAWCKTRENESVLVRFKDVPIFCHISLPTFIGKQVQNWNDKRTVTRFVEYLKRCLKEDAPTMYQVTWKEKLYYYQKRDGSDGTLRKRYPYLMVLFKTEKAMNHCRAFLSQIRNIDGIGAAMFHVHETDINPVRKLLSLTKTKFAQWFSVDAVEVPEASRLSKVRQFDVVDYQTLTPVPEEETGDWIVRPKVLSFDIETYSKNHRKMPQAQLCTDPAYIITVITQTDGMPETRKSYGIIFGNIDDIPGTEIIRVNSELDLIHEFCKLIDDYDPDIITGYNIFGFDWPYLDARLGRHTLRKAWPNCSRMKSSNCTVDQNNWSSSGYGKNRIAYLVLEGRITIDLLPVVRRDHKLRRYDLDTVGLRFVNKGKHPVSVKEMFEQYQEHSEVWQQGLAILGKKKHQATFEELDAIPDPEFQERYKKSKDTLTGAMKRGIDDALIVVLLFETLGVWFAALEMSSINGIPMMHLFTKGQSVRCTSLIYDECVQRGIVMERRMADKIPYVGGHVNDPVKGRHRNIICLDFASLYPSIIQANNIDYTTYVPPDDTSTPDSDCHIVEWEEDISQATLDDNEEEEEDLLKTSESKRKSKKKKDVEPVMVKRRYRFYKHFEGIVPKIVRELVSQRRRVRAIKTGDPVQKTILNARQLALKITANSFYGYLGFQTGGKYSLIEGATSTTATGRQLLARVDKWLVEEKNGNIVYGDTDSVMVNMGIKDRKECNAIGLQLSKEISDQLPHPLAMEFEKAMDIVCFTKKKYAYFLIKKDGSLDMETVKDAAGVERTQEKIQTKGIVLARRDNFMFLRKVYEAILRNVLKGGSFKDTVSIFTSHMREFLSDSIGPEDLSIVRELGDNYSSDNFFMKVFADELKKAGKPASPGERLEFVICKSNESLLGKKMRLLTDFTNPQSDEILPEIDKAYYIEKLMMKSLEQLIEVGHLEEAESLSKLGYKPKGRYHFIPAIRPVKILVRLMAEGEVDPVGKLESIIYPKKVFKIKVVGKQESPTQPKIVKIPVKRHNLVLE